MTSQSAMAVVRSPVYTAACSAVGRVTVYVVDGHRRDERYRESTCSRVVGRPDISEPTVGGRLRVMLEAASSGVI